MADVTLPDSLVHRNVEGGRIVLFVLDGLGGLPHPETGRTELETARTPNLDALAARSSVGLLVPVAPGVAPGSGPGHLALFGYDPVRHLVGRGVLSALGVGFQLRPGDLAARLNLATVDGEGRVVDRRAGRPSDEEGRRIVERICAGLRPPEGLEVFVEHEKEHRAALVVRGEGLVADLSDTDPQAVGVPPEPVRALSPTAEETARRVGALLEQMGEIIRDEPRVNAVLARGFAMYEAFPSLEERFGLRAVAFAAYPMYRGVARLVGMEVGEVPATPGELPVLLERHFHDFDFFFLHFKTPDSRGEDGDFDAKVAAIEEADALVPRIQAVGPDVLVVTGDHSTPATFRAHSWHPVPLLLASAWARPSTESFGESGCRGGDLGFVRGPDLMSLMLAHAGRLAKFGA